MSKKHWFNRFSRNATPIAALMQVMMAFCAIVAIIQTSHTQYEISKINQKTSEYYKNQNKDVLDPKIHVVYEFENTNEVDEITIPPSISNDAYAWHVMKFHYLNHVVRGIEIHNVGASVRDIHCGILTLLEVHCIPHPQSKWVKRFKGRCYWPSFLVPIKGYYSQFEHTTKVTGLIAKGKSCDFQRYVAMSSFQCSTNDMHFYVNPVDIVNVIYIDNAGQKHQVIYEGDRLVGTDGKFYLQPIIAENYKKLFGNKVFDYSCFDFKSIIENTLKKDERLLYPEFPWDDVE